MLDATGKLAVAQLVIYAILIIPSAYVLWKHGWPGALGWFYLCAFCALRIVGSALQVQSEGSGSTNTTALIISGVGLSPLMFLSAGILHELHHYPGGTKHFVIPSLVVHVVVVVALALVIVGYQPNQNDGKTLRGVGYVIFCVVWVVIVALTAFSWKQTSFLMSNSRKLLYGITTALPFVGIRVLYGCISAFDTHIGSSGPIRYRVCLSVLMEMLAVIILVAAGIWTRHIRDEARKGREEATVLPQKANMRTRAF